MSSLSNIFHPVYAFRQIILWQWVSGSDSVPAERGFVLCKQLLIFDHLSSVLILTCEWTPPPPPPAPAPIGAAASSTTVLTIHWVQRWRQWRWDMLCARRPGCTFVLRPSQFKQSSFPEGPGGLGCTYSSEQAGQLAAGKSHCWDICCFDVFPLFVGPRWHGTTSALQKTSISMTCHGTHSCWEPQASGQDAVRRTPPGHPLFPSHLLLVPGGRTP